MDHGSQPLGVGHSKMVERSAQLLMNPIKFGEPGFDKVFVAGRISREGSHWRLDVMDDYPVVALNDAIRQEFGLVNCPTVKELRDQEVGELSLISGGSFLWIRQGGSSKLLLLKRDLSAPTDAGLMTGPAGRCDKTMSATIREETNEELVILKSVRSNNRVRYKSLGFCWGGKSGDDVIDFKLQQADRKAKDLLEKGQYFARALLQAIKGAEDVELVSLKPVDSAVQSDSVSFYVNGVEVDRVDNCLAYFDAENNTLEVRQIFQIDFAKGEDLRYACDGEFFGREVVLLNSLDEVPEALAVPALKNYKRKAASVARLE